MPGKLGRTSKERNALLRNQASQLLWYGRIETTAAKAKELMALVSDLDAEYGVAWQGESESDEAIAKIDYVLKKLCGDAFQTFFERNDLILDWWERGVKSGTN